MDPRVEAKWCEEIVGYEREAMARREDGDVVGVWCYTALAARLLLALQETNSAGARRCEKQVGKTLGKLNNEMETAKKRYCERRAELLGSGLSSEAHGETKGDCAPLTKHEIKFVAGTKACTEYWFSRIIGLKETKSALVSGFIQPLLYPTLFDQTRAILLYGPPGTGKTLLATAAVNELAAQSGGSIEVRYFAIPPSVFRQKYVGVGEKNIETIFDCAAEVARTKPGEPKKLAVIFIDEMEGIAGDRSKDASGTSAGPVATLLQKMEGIASAENVVVLGATNYPWNMDSAILSRFKERILVDLPTALDLDRFINLEISKRVELVLRDRLDDTPERLSELRGGGCTTEPPPLQFDSHRQASGIRIPLSPEVIQAIATQMYRRGYSMRDADSVMVKANKAMGLRAVASGIFYRVGNKYVCKDGQNVASKTELFAFRGRDADHDFPVKGGARAVKIHDDVYYHRSLYIGPLFLNDELIDDYFVAADGDSSSVRVLAKVKVRVTQASDDGETAGGEGPRGLEEVLGTEPLTMDRTASAVVTKLSRSKKYARVVGAIAGAGGDRGGLDYYARSGSRVEHYYIPFTVGPGFVDGVHTLRDLFSADKSARYAYTPWGVDTVDTSMTQVDLTKLQGSVGSRLGESVVAPDLLSLRTLKYATGLGAVGVATGGLAAAGAIAGGVGALAGAGVAKLRSEGHQVDYVRLCNTVAEGVEVADLFSVEPGLASTTTNEAAVQASPTAKPSGAQFVHSVSLLPDGAQVYTFAYTQDILTEAIAKVPPSYNKALHKSLLRYSIDAGLETECRAPALGENMEKCEKAFLAKHPSKKAAVAGRFDGK